MNDAASLKQGHGRILAISLLSTTIEFYDFFIYGTAAALVFGQLFFPAGSAFAQSVGAWGSFALAFFARPLGGALFGHLGDLRGRRESLFAAMTLMTVCTVSIGLLPSHGRIGWAAPVLLCVLRFCQGLGLGGQWGGAVLLAVESAPRGREGIYGAVPQLGAPLSFLISSGLFLVLATSLNEAQFLAWGWRVPFFVSAPLMLLALYTRKPLIERQPPDPVVPRASMRVPIVELFRSHAVSTLLGTIGVVVCFVLYYLVTAFALSYGTVALGHLRQTFLLVQMAVIPFMAAGTLLSGLLSRHIPTSTLLLTGAAMTVPTGLLLAPLVQAGPQWAFAFLCSATFFLGLMYGPLGSWLPGLFPPALRYTGASLAFNIAGVIGGSLTPLGATYLAANYGLQTVGLGLAIAGLSSMLAVHAARRRESSRTTSRSVEVAACED